MSDRYNKIIIDWLAFTVHDLSLNEVFELLGFSDIISDFEAGKGSNGYLDRLYYDHVSIHFNGRDDMGIHINLSGQGCRVFETYSNYGHFDELLLRILSLKKYNITRLDIAYDDFCNYLPMNEIVHSVRLGEWLSPSNMQWWEAVYSSAGVSSYIGSPRSNIRFRFYDKAAEQGKDYQWSRLEIQLRDMAAVMFAYNWLIEGSELSDLFFGIVNKYIRFINLDNPRKTRCSMKTWWSSFIKEGTEVCLRLPGVEYNLGRLRNMAIDKAGNAVQTFISIYGFSEFMRILDKEKPISKLPVKYKSLANAYIDSYSDNHTTSHFEKIGDDIIEIFDNDLPVKLERLRNELNN